EASRVARGPEDARGILDEGERPQRTKAPGAHVRLAAERIVHARAPVPPRAGVAAPERPSVEPRAGRSAAALDGRGAEAAVHEQGAADLLGEPTRERHPIALDDQVDIGRRGAEQQIAPEP